MEETCEPHKKTQTKYTSKVLAALAEFLSLCPNNDPIGAPSLGAAKSMCTVFLCYGAK